MSKKSKKISPKKWTVKDLQPGRFILQVEEWGQRYGAHQKAVRLFQIGTWIIKDSRCWCLVRLLDGSIDGPHNRDALLTQLNNEVYFYRPISHTELWDTINILSNSIEGTEYGAR